MKQNRNVSYLNQNKTKLNYVIKFSLIECSLQKGYAKQVTSKMINVLYAKRIRNPLTAPFRMPTHQAVLEGILILLLLIN